MKDGEWGSDATAEVKWLGLSAEVEKCCKNLQK